MVPHCTSVRLLALDAARRPLPAAIRRLGPHRSGVRSQSACTHEQIATGSHSTTDCPLIAQCWVTYVVFCVTDPSISPTDSRAPASSTRRPRSATPRDSCDPLCGCGLHFLTSLRYYEDLAANRPSCVGVEAPLVLDCVWRAHMCAPVSYRSDSAKVARHVVSPPNEGCVVYLRD